MDVRQLQDMCFVMLVSATACVIFLNASPAFLSPFAITCRPGPKLTRSEIFVSVYQPKRVVPV